MGFIATDATVRTGQTNGSTQAIPSIVQNGDRVYVAIMAVNPTGITLGGSLAFTAVGGGVQSDTLNASAFKYGLWKHDWVTGDATSFTVTTSGGVTFDICFLVVKSDTLASGSWTTVNGTYSKTLGSNTPAVNQVSPTDATWDTRLVFVFENSTAHFGWARSTPTYQTLSERSTPVTSGQTTMLMGEGQQNFDSAAGTIQNTSANNADVVTFGVALNDGSSAHYAAGEDMEKTLNEVDSAVPVWGLASDTGGDESANARWEGGGPRLLS